MAPVNDFILHGIYLQYGIKLQQLSRQAMPDLIIVEQGIAQSATGGWRESFHCGATGLR